MIVITTIFTVAFLALVGYALSILFAIGHNAVMKDHVPVTTHLGVAFVSCLGIIGYVALVIKMSLMLLTLTL